MKNFFQLCEASMEDRLQRHVVEPRQRAAVPYTERYIRPLLAITSLVGARESCGHLAPVIKAISKTIQVWRSFLQETPAEPAVTAIAESWRHVPEMFNKLRKEIELATPAAINKWSGEIIAHIGQANYEKELYKRMPRNNPPADDLASGGDTAAEANANLVKAVWRFRESFGQGEPVVVGTPSYMSPEQVKGEDQEREFNFTRRIAVALNMMDEVDPRLHNRIQEALTLLEEGAYYFINIYLQKHKEVAPHIQHSFDSRFNRMIGAALGQYPGRAKAPVVPDDVGEGDHLQKTVNLRMPGGQGNGM